MKRFLYLLIALFLLGGLFFFFKPKQQSVTNTTPSVSVLPTQLPSTSFTLVVKENKLISGPEVLSVTQGQTITITITADVDGQLHIHGYDKVVEFQKDQPATISFVADLTGRFPYELEDTGTEIGSLEVTPK